MGDNHVDYFSPREANPYIFGGASADRQTPTIQALLGGAERFGFLDGLGGMDLSQAFDFDVNVAGRNQASASGMVAVYRVDLSAEQVLNFDINGDGVVDPEHYTGFDMLLMINLTDVNLPAPRLGVHMPDSTDTTLSQPLMFQGAFEQTPVELTALNARTAWVTLIPETATKVTASIAGTTVESSPLTTSLVKNVSGHPLSKNDVTYIGAGRPNLDEYIVTSDFQRLVDVQSSVDDRHIYAISEDRDALLVLNASDGSIAQVFEDFSAAGSINLTGINEIIAPADGRFVYAMSPGGQLGVFARDGDTGNLTLSMVQDLEAEFAQIRQGVFHFTRGEFKGLSWDETTGLGIGLFTEIRENVDTRSVLQRFQADPDTGEIKGLRSGEARSGRSNYVLIPSHFPIYLDVELMDDHGIILLSPTSVDKFSSSPTDPFFLNQPAEKTFDLGPLGISTPTRLVRSDEYLHVVSETENAIATFAKTFTSGLADFGYVDTIKHGVDGGIINGPSGVTTSSDGGYVFVANELDDSISVFQRNRSATDSSLLPAKFVQVLRDDFGGVSGIEGSGRNRDEAKRRGHSGRQQRGQSFDRSHCRFR